MLVFYDSQTGNKGGIYVKFDFGGVFPEGTVVNSAVIDLYQSAASGATPILLTAHLITSDWNSNVTWNTKPTIGQALGAESTNNTKAIRSWDITQTMRKWFDRSLRNYGIYITYDGPLGQSFSRTFDTLDTHSVFQPVLRVDYTPPQQNNAGGRANQPAVGGFGQPNFNPVINVDPIWDVDLNIFLISNIKSENVTQTGATIKWTTNKNSTSWVFYGTAQDGSDRFDKQTGKDDATGNHTINLANLEPGIKYSYKVFSKDATGKQAFGSIKYFTTLAVGAEEDQAMGAAGNVPEEESLNENPVEENQNLISGVKDKIENKVAEYTIEKSLSEDNPANNLPASGSAEVSETNLNPTGAVSKFAGFVGLSQLAGILLIILALMTLTGAFILYKLTRKAHHHIRKHFDPDFAKTQSKKKK